MTLIKFSATGFSMLMLAAGPALADKPMTKYFGALNSCYARDYSAAHLNKHPLQKVSAIRLDHFPRLSGPFGNDGKPLLYPNAPEIVINLSVTFRSDGTTHRATGFCWPEGRGLSCGLECDGGQFKLKEAKDGKLLITGGSDIYFHDCDAGDRVLERNPDDKSFLLSRVPDAQCLPPR